MDTESVAKNGRIDLSASSGVPDAAPFSMFSDQGRGVRDTMASDALRTMELNATGILFMSPANIDSVHDGIRYQVYLRSNHRHVIDRQSDTEVVAIMRSVFLQHGRNTTCKDGGADIAEVRRLNSIVIDYSVERILAEIDIYLTYRKDIQQLPTPMTRGEFASNKGTRSLVVREF